MSREIKFRAWHTVNKVIIDNKNLSVLAKNIKDDNVWKFMQFTGLIDKNGVEIYEGDIIKRITHFEDGGCDVHLGVVTWDDCNYYSRSIKNEISRSLCYKSGNTTYEIIGNIHENPELL